MHIWVHFFVAWQLLISIRAFLQLQLPQLVFYHMVSFIEKTNGAPWNCLALLYRILIYFLSFIE